MGLALVQTTYLVDLCLLMLSRIDDPPLRFCWVEICSLRLLQYSAPGLTCSPLGSRDRSPIHPPGHSDRRLASNQVVES